MTDIVVSGKAQKLVNEANANYGKAKELISAAYLVLTEEDKLPPMEAKKFLMETCTIFSDRTIRSLLPPESKDQRKALAGRQRHKKSAANLQHNTENTPDNNAKITYKDSSEVQIPQDKPTIIEAETIPEMEEKIAAETGVKVSELQLTNLTSDAPRELGMLWTRIELTKVIPGTTVSLFKKLTICLNSGGIAYISSINGNATEVISATEFIKRGIGLEARA